jgi:hypothetical protein
MTTFVSGSTTRGIAWSTSFSTALFQPFCTKIKAALDGAGLVQTSDTGQLNVATVTYPGTDNTYTTGYLIYRFNDSLQGTDPVFLKIFLGRGSSSALVRMRVDIGQGSDGAGNLTGTVYSNKILIAGDYAISGIDPACTDYSCHQEGYFMMMHGAVPAERDYPPRIFLAIERTRNQTTGSFDGRGVCLIFAGANHITGSCFSDFILWGVGSPASAAHQQFCIVPGSRTTDSSGDYIAYPHFYWDEGVIKRTWSWWTTHASSLPFGANTFDASPYGTARRWLGIGNDGGRAIRGVNNPTLAPSWGLVVLWEA